MYFFSSQNGLLTELDMETNNTFYLPMIVDEVCGQAGSIDIVQIHNNKIYALKNAGDGLIEYDLNEDTYRCFNPECAEKLWGNYIYMTEHNSQLFIFCRAINRVKVFDCNTKEFTTIEYDIENQTFTFGTRVDDVVWLFPKNGRMVAAFDLNARKVSTYIIDITFEDAVNCWAEDGEIYIITIRGDILVWNTEETDVDTFRKAKSNEQVGRIVVTEKKIILLPSLGQNIIVIERDTCQERIYEEYPEGFRYEANPGWSKYYGYCRDANKIYFAMRSANFMLIIDKKTGEMSWKKPLGLSDENKMELYVNGGKLQLTEGEFSLTGFIDYLSGK